MTSIEGIECFSYLPCGPALCTAFFLCYNHFAFIVRFSTQNHTAFSFLQIKQKLLVLSLCIVTVRCWLCGRLHTQGCVAVMCEKECLKIGQREDFCNNMDDVQWLSDEDLKRLQGVMRGILQEIDRVCRENDIQYSMCSGTMIGAAVHQDFLPWDDDADLMMDRANYDRFIEIFPQKCNKPYQLAHHTTSEDFFFLYAKVEDTTEKMIEKLHETTLERNVFVDVTVFDGVDGPVSEKWKRLFGAYVSLYKHRRCGLLPRSPLKRFLYRLIAWPRSNRSEHRLYQRYDALCRRVKRPAYLTELIIPTQRLERYDASLFSAYQNIPFAGLQLMNIQNMDSYFMSAFQKTEFHIDEENRATHCPHALRLLPSANEKPAC